MRNERINKSLSACLLFLLCLFMCGWTIPESNPYVVVNCSAGNNIRIYFGVGDVDKLSVTDDSIINIYSGTVSGYSNQISEQYAVSFPLYSAPTYRTGTNYNSYYLNITKVVENHLYDDDSVSFSSNTNIIFVSLLSSLLVIQFLNLFKR